MPATKRHIDVEGQKIGSVYAEGLYDAAAAQGKTAELIEEFDSLISDVFDAYPKFERLLASEMIDTEEKKQMIDRTLASQTSPLLLNFLRVCADRERLRYLRAISRELHAIHNERLGRVHVDVTAAAPMDEQTTSGVRDQIARMLGQEPEINVLIDPELIGGIQVRVGDTVYDGSVAAELRRMREAIVQRNSVEIEGNREKFQHGEV